MDRRRLWIAPNLKWYVIKRVSLPWTRCVLRCLQHHLELESCQFGNCSNSTIFRRAFDESTRKDFVSKLDRLWIRFELSILKKIVNRHVKLKTYAPISRYTYLSIYRTRAIISRGLYIFYPIFNCGFYCRAVSITENLCNKKKIHIFLGLKPACTVIVVRELRKFHLKIISHCMKWSIQM